MNFSANTSEASQCTGAAANAAYDKIQQQSPSFPDQESNEAVARQLQTSTPISLEVPPQGNTPGPFDMSNYDNLQDHAYQLSASAGYAPGHEQRQTAPVPATETLENQVQVHQQVYYYPSLQPEMQYAPAQAPAMALSASQPVYTMPPAMEPLAPNQGRAQQYYQMPTSAQNAQTYIQPQVQAQPGPHLASYPLATSSSSEPSDRIGSKRSFYVPEEPENKRQSLAHQGGRGAHSFSPQNVPSGSSTGFDFDDDIDPILRPPPANYATMSAEEKRRYERNVREQQRSFKISQQIKELRNVLAESNISFKPNKFSILMSVVDYVKQLQSRAIMLDAEHRKLIDTIRQTHEMVNAGLTPAPDETQSRTLDHGVSVSDSDMLFVQGLDYEAVFQHCPAALGVAALDGRILACNDEFAAISGISRETLLRQSLFNLMNNHEDVFRAMGAMLSSGCANVQPTEKENPNPPAPIYWSGVVNQKSQSLFMNITLTRSDDGLPKFFNCALSAA